MKHVAGWQLLWVWLRNGVHFPGMMLTTGLLYILPNAVGLLALLLRLTRLRGLAVIPAAVAFVHALAVLLTLYLRDSAAVGAYLWVASFGALTAANWMRWRAHTPLPDPRQQRVANPWSGPRAPAEDGESPWTAVEPPEPARPYRRQRW